MAAFGDMLGMQLVLFLLIAVGLLAAKIRLIDATARAYLTELIITVVLPCNIVASFLVDFDLSVLRSLGTALLVGFGIQLFCLGLSRLLYRRAPHGQRMVLRYGTICSNATFIGNPVIDGLYGAEGLLYASVYLIPLRIFMWTAGLACFTSTTPRGAMKKLVRHPCIIATVLGFALMVTGLRPPAFVATTLTTIGGCTTALSMFVIGSILAEVPAKTIISRRALGFSAIRLVLIPLCVLGALALLRPAAIVTRVSVVLAGMPAGATTAILAAKYGGDAPFASKLVCLSTLLSLLTVPLLAALLNLLA